MDPKCSAQDVLRCDQCESPSVDSHCDTCQSRLCNDCVTRGRCSVSSTPHQVVSYTESRIMQRYPQCSQHADKHCQLYCQNCDTAVCSTCISSSAHRGHEFSDVLKKPERKEAGILQMMESDIRANEQLENLSELSIRSQVEEQGFNTLEAQCSLPYKPLLETPKQETVVHNKTLSDKLRKDNLISEKTLLEKPVSESKLIQEKPMEVKNKAKSTSNKAGSPNVAGISEREVRSMRGVQDKVITQYSIRSTQQTRNGYMVYTEETHIVQKLGHNLGVSLHRK